MSDKRIGIITNFWGWNLRGLGRWVSTWAFPWTVHGVEITSEVPRIHRPDWPACLHVYKRIVRVGFVWFVWGRYTQGFYDGQPIYFDAAGDRVLQYPHGRYQHWQRRRRNAQIARDNARRATDKAMREGWS